MKFARLEVADIPMASKASLGPVPPPTPPPSIAMLAMVDAALPQLQERKAKLERRLAMQKDLVSITERELQELTGLIAKRTTQQDEALRRLHASDEQGASSASRPSHPDPNEQRPRPSKSRKLG